MPYVVPPLNDEMRAAMGDTAASAAPVFVYESQMPSPYISELMGMTLESSVAVPIVQAGEILNTTKGDFVRVKYSVVKNGEIVEVEVVQADVGAGETQLQTVVSANPVNDPNAGAYEEPVEPPPPPPAPESSLEVPPTTDPSVETTVHAEVPTAEPEYQASTTLPDGSTLVSSGTASPTQDAIGYGELDVNGNPVQTSSGTDSSNYDAQYDGL